MRFRNKYLRYEINYSTKESLFVISKQPHDCFRKKVVSRDQFKRAKVAVFQAIILHVTVLKMVITEHTK